MINFLLSTEIIPLCLRIMETGSELSKTVAIFIVQKILLDEMGLNYICQTYERFYAVGTVLSNMVNQLVESQAVRLLKHVVRWCVRPAMIAAHRAQLPSSLGQRAGSRGPARVSPRSPSRCHLLGRPQRRPHHDPLLGVASAQSVRPVRRGLRVASADVVSVD